MEIIKSFSHWTPRYIVDRIGEILYQKRYPEHPWLTKSANLIPSSYLKKSDIGLEWGSGRSTLWFARRVLSLTSIEHDPSWYNRILKALKENEISNVTYLLFEKDQNEDKGQDSAYVQVVRKFPKNSLDFVIVEGIYRSACACAVLEKISPSGILVIDNANWYLPSNSFSPNSRTKLVGPASSQWQTFLVSVENWRCIWTSNGVTDTAIYFKPCCQQEKEEKCNISKKAEIST
ncbi:class I SAM-dependent methyltransferase [Thermodesulfovibrionales bacterium]|nr:class I SAM-dependent methyltransferase [Thermodesulfovibrionales bacterium]